MSKTTTTVSISSADLATVRGGLGSGPNKDWSASSGFGAIFKGQGSDRTDKSYGSDQLMQACTMANTSPKGTVDQAAAGKCFLDNSKAPSGGQQ